MRNDNQLFGRKRQKFLPKSAQRFRSEEIPKPQEGESTVIFLTALLVNLVFAYLFKYVWVVGSNDAIQQTSKALYLLYSEGSPLSSITLIHPPLPVFLQLVPVPILRLINASAFSGPLLTALFGAGTLVMLNRILLLLRVHDRYRWILLLLTQFFPSFLYAAAIGTADMIHVFMVLVVVWGGMLINLRQMAFLVCGLGLTLGFFIQYRIVSMLAGIFLALSILKWNRHENWQEELEGWLLAFLTPPLYAISLWFLLNWLNQNDPFYFINSLFDPIQSPSIARNVGAMHPYFLGWDSVIEAVAITATSIWETSALFIIGTTLSIFFGFHFNRRYIIANLLIILSLPAALAFLIFLGVLPSWQYLWAALIPLSIILACQAYQDLKPRSQNILMIGVFILILASIWINFQSLGNRSSATGEQRFQAILLGDTNRETDLRESDPYWIFQHDAPIVANALDRYSQEGKIIVDGTVAAPALIRTKHLDQMIIQKNLSISNIFSLDSAEATFVLLHSMDEPLNNHTLVYPAPQLESENIDRATRVWTSNQTILDWGIYQLVLENLQ